MTVHEYVETSYFTPSGDRLIVVSDHYIDHLTPSRKELVSGALGGFCAGLSIWIVIGWLFSRPIWLSLGVAAMFAAIWFNRQFLQLRRERLHFLRSCEAKQTGSNHETPNSFSLFKTSKLC